MCPCSVVLVSKHSYHEMREVRLTHETQSSMVANVLRATNEENLVW
jgi:hypothetical protein